jgi:membrane fusion protein (multidrug efflux system)
MSSFPRTAPVVLALALALGACDGKKGPAVAPPAPEVGVVTMAPQAVDLATELSGRTSAYRIAEVRPQVNGIIRRRLFTEGAEVTAGQVLYEIDSGPYRAAAARARANLVSSEAQLNAARLQADRSASLVESGVVSRQDNDNVQAAARSAEAAVAAAKAGVESARIDLAYAQVRSPIAGRIGRSLVTEGGLVTSGQDQVLATIAQLDPIFVDVTESSAQILRLRRDLAEGRLQRTDSEHARVQLTLEDGSGYAHDGTLKFSEVTVDQGTGSVLLRAEFPNPDRLLLPGMFVRAHLSQGHSAETLLLPQAAVSRNARGEAVVMLVGADDIVSERIIVVDRVMNNQWVVNSGLAAGDTVVVEGLQKARPGSKVRPMPVGTGASVAPAGVGG